MTNICPFVTFNQDKVNIIPIIGKADTLTKEELERAKSKIRMGLKHFDIDVFQIPPCDPMEDVEILLEVRLTQF